ncbi:MAG: signal peptidase II, partial [Deltaproteobacteria bacterium]|nr:signal peptidase II [Deltaproteobacteria bacterium]
LAGALGNFADRLHFGYVVDFIDLSIGRLRWATFNIADVAITTGVIMIFLEMIVATLREHRSRRRHA